MKDLLLTLLLATCVGGAFFHFGMAYQQVKCMKAFTEWMFHDTLVGADLYKACTGSEWR